MAVQSTGYNFYDFSTLTELFPRIPKFLDQLGLFGEAVYGKSTIAEVERVQDGVDAIVAQARDADRNYAGGETAIQRNFNIPFFPLDSKKMGAQDIQDMKDFAEDPNIPMTMQKRMDRAQMRIAKSHAVLKERARYAALKGTSYAPNDAKCQYDYATEFGVSAKVHAAIPVDFTDAATDPRSAAETARRHIQKYAGDQADAYQIIVICGSTFFDNLKSHTLVREAYNSYPSDAEPLRKRLGGNFINRSWVTENVTYLEDTVGQQLGEIAATEAYVLPLGIEDMFQTHFAPADHPDYANQTSQDLYMFVEETPRKSQVQTETSFIMVNTRSELVVKLTS
jgi:hypothetical protein